jgi:hypothetical protein
MLTFVAFVVALFIPVDAPYSERLLNHDKWLTTSIQRSQHLNTPKLLFFDYIFRVARWLLLIHCI